MSTPLELFGHPVLGRLGDGAASVIYKVRDPGSSRLLALKHVVKRSDKDQRFLDQVESEHRIGSTLRHRGIRAIGRLRRKRQRFRTVELGLLMEYVEAPGLDGLSRPTPSEAVRIFLRIAEALHVMHEQGFVHADMKPTNVLVGDDLVKVIDLGQACEIGTRKSRIQGTPGYIAPEQAARRRITERTDVYNFGATMYWMLTGREVPTAGPGNGTGAAVPPAANRLNPQVPAELAEIISLSLEPNSHGRWKNMHAVVRQLDKLPATRVEQSKTA